jgi:hypothetical protein
MASILERTRDFVRQAQSSPTQLPSRIVVPVDHVLDGEATPDPFRPNEHYFQVRVNEMFLASSRQWFARFDPMVFVVSEFIYDKKVQAVPFVVGPTMLEKYGQKLPTGMILADTRVAGPHPYKGGRVTVAVVLSQVETVNYARNLLQIVESTAGLSFATGLGTYLLVADVVLDGLEALFGLETITPVMGFRKEFDPDGGETFSPSWFALIDLPEDQVDPDQLWVRDGRLLAGASAEDLRPFRQADFVLYSIGQDRETSELEILPFYPLWERVAEAAMKSSKNADDPNWESARSDMQSLYQTLMLSPDLTTRQGQELTDSYIARAQALREHGMKIAEMGPAEPAAEEENLERIRARVGSILAD